MTDNSESGEIKYRLIRSNRKTIAITIDEYGDVIVKAPIRASRAAIERFLWEKEDWIRKTVNKQKNRASLNAGVEKLSYEDMKRYADITMERIRPLLQEYSIKLGVTYNRVTVRNQKTRWGSCSGKKNLNFNCLLAAVPDSVVKYVVVHELCHLLEMNHSKRFWILVENQIPDYKQDVKWLKDNGHFLIARLP